VMTIPHLQKYAMMVWTTIMTALLIVKTTTVLKRPIVLLKFVMTELIMTTTGLLTAMITTVLKPPTVNLFFYLGLSLMSMAKYLGLLLVFVLTGCLNGQVKTAANGIAFSADFLTSAQAELLYEKAKAFPNHTELSLALLENEKIRFVGIKRLNDTLRVTENHQHVFEIGSISKVFTSTLLAEFALDETLRLSDAIQDYVSFPIGTPEKITFQSLANHTSGLPRLPSNLHLLFVDRDNPYKGYDSAKLITYLTDKIPLEHAAETRYAYSNLGAGRLGYALAELRDTAYENLLQEKIFKPYGMYSSSTQMETLNAPIVRGLN